MHTKNKHDTKRTAFQGRVENPDKKKERPWTKWLYYAITAILIAGLSYGVYLFFKLDQSNHLTHLIQSTGILGVVIAVAIMALLSLLPVPSEFFMILNMKVFGAWSGMLYSWIGTMISAVVTFILARYYGRRLLEKFISQKQFKQVSAWIADRGITGLLLSRIVPLPFIVVNYTAGISRSVNIWNYIWTSAVGGIPYYVGAALVFLGFSKKYITWLVVGGVVVLVIWIAGYLHNRHVQMFKRGLH